MLQTTELGFVVAAERNGNTFFRSFHQTVALANQSLRRTIDVDKLQIVEASVQFGNNGNVRRWDLMPNA
ncbi:MAG: hypothetical protein ABL885_05930 [Methylophilaceae bacterium]